MAILWTTTYLPFLDQRPKLVCGHVHAMEVGKAVLSLDILTNQFKLPECNLVILKVSQ